MRYYLDHPDMQASDESTSKARLTLRQLNVLKELIDDQDKLSAALQYLSEKSEAKGNDDEDDNSIYWSGLANILKIASDRSIF